MSSTPYMNELDTVYFYIDKCNCRYDEEIAPSGSIIGAYYEFKNNNIFFNISSKLFATANCLGAITKDNIEEIAGIIENAFGIKIDTAFLCEEVLLARVDVKKDRIMSDNPSFYLSYLRNLFKRNTSKFDVHKHEYMTYDQGLKLTPKTKQKFCYSLYHKGNELKRASNKKFRESFDYDYLMDLNNCLRVEAQFKNFETIRNAFHLKSNEKQTFASVLTQDVDVVGEQLNKLFI